MCINVKSRKKKYMRGNGNQVLLFPHLETVFQVTQGKREESKDDI